MKKVAFISQPEYFRFMYEDYLDDVFDVKEFPFSFGMPAEKFNDLMEFNADYNIFFRGEFFPEEALNKLNGIKIALSSEPFPRNINGKWEYTKDSILRYLTFRTIRNKSFDYIFHYDKSSMKLFENDNLNISGEFIFPVALDTYRVKTEEKKWDLFFIGRSTAHRENLFGSLKHHYNFLHIAHGIHGKDLVQYINKSSICINAHAENEISWEPRIQMMLAAGAFVLSEKITPNNYLTPEVEFVEFTNANDLYNKVEHYLGHKVEMEKFIENAQKTINTHFDAKKSFLDLFDRIENKKIQKFKRSPEQICLRDKLFYRLEREDLVIKNKFK